MRFERGTDPRLPVTAMERACALLEMIGAGTARGTVVDRYPVRIEPTVLRLRRAAHRRAARRVDSRRGRPQRARERSASRFATPSGGWDITVPTRRVDVHARSRSHRGGRASLRLRPDSGDVPGVDRRAAAGRSTDHAHQAASRAGDGQGFSEAVTFGFTSAPAAEAFADRRNDRADQEPVVGSVRRAAAVAASRAWSSRRDATCGAASGTCSCSRSATASRSRAARRRRSAFIWTGAGRPQHWSERHARGGLLRCDEPRVDDRGCAWMPRSSSAADALPRVPGRRASGRSRASAKDSSARRRRGSDWSASWRRDVGELLGLPAEVPAYVAEVAIEPLARFRRTSLKASRRRASRPSIATSRSSSTTRRQRQSVRDDRRARSPIPHLAGLREFDRYAGKGHSRGKVSLSLRLTFRSADRTLTDAEVQSAMDDGDARAQGQTRRGAALSQHGRRCLPSSPFVAPSVRTHALIFTRIVPDGKAGSSDAN